VNLRGVLLVWIGLMGLAGAVASFVLLRLFPRAFVDSGPAVAWPWQTASGSARVKGWLVAVAGLASAAVAVIGIASFLS
jgi:hypothetical protein